MVCSLAYGIQRSHPKDRWLLLCKNQSVTLIFRLCDRRKRMGGLAPVHREGGTLFFPEVLRKG